MPKPKHQKLSINWPPAGQYIVAVSGGVDSVVLLDLLVGHQAANYALEVAYFDHGWRDDVELDQAVVADLAERYNLPVHFGKYEVKSSSEASAREQRYAFLESIRQQTAATAIITAHHADDQVETAVFNTLRGTGSAGLAPIRTNNLVLRPLLSMRKAELLAYAADHQLHWHEDSTNLDIAYTRNFIRQQLLTSDPDLATNLAAQMTDLGAAQDELTAAIQAWLAQNSSTKPDGAVILQRKAIARLTLDELEAVLYQVVRQVSPDQNPQRQTVAEMARFAKAAQTGKVLTLAGGWQLEIGNAEFKFNNPSSS